MKYSITLLFGFIILSLFACKKEETVEPVITTPQVRIISPTSNEVLGDTVLIQIEATDDKGITKVEIYIDNAIPIGGTLLLSPYKFVWDISNLPDSSGHLIYAKAYDSDGNVTGSSTLTVVSYRFTPSNLTATVMNDTLISLSWQDNSRKETGFEIERSFNNNGYSLVKTVGADITSIEIPGAYLITDSITFRICAVAGESKSKYSNIAGTRIIFQSPSNLTVTFISDTLVQLQWQDNSTFETSFEIEKSTDGINYTLVGSVGANISTMTVIDTYYTNTTYYFRTRAKAMNNKSLYSNIVSDTLSFPPPFNLSVTSISETEMRLQWQDNNALETGFEIEKSVDGVNFTLIDSARSNITTKTIIDTFFTTTTYFFRVRAKSVINKSSYSNIASKTLIFKVPSGLIATSISETKMKLQWQDNSTFESGFDIEMSTNGVNFSLVDSSGSNITTAFVTSNYLITNTYYFRVRAISKLNKSDYSNVASSTLNFLPPSNFSITSISQKEVELNWIDNCQFERGFKIERRIANVGFVEIALVDSNSIKWRDTSVNKRQVYEYRIRAYSNLNNSAYSSQIKVYWQLYDATLDNTLFGHSSVAYGVAFNSDGTTIASGSADRTVKLWRASDGTLLRTLNGHTNNVQCVAFSPDGTLVASGGFDNKIKLWKASDGTLLRTLSGHSSYVTAVAFSYDGTIIASGSSDRTVKLWRLNDGTIIHTFAGHSYDISSVAFRSDGNIIASASYDNSLKLWKINDGTILHTFMESGSAILTVAFSPNGEIVAGGTGNRTIKLWKVTDGTMTALLNGHSDPVWSIVFSSNGGTLISSSSDRTIKLWNVFEETLMGTLAGSTSTIFSIAISPDDDQIASVDGNVIKLWKTKGVWRSSTYNGE